MIKLDATKDGLGNIIITEYSFDFLLSCLDSQKYIPHPTLRSDPDGQKVIDICKRECKKILGQKYIFETCEDDYFLFKKYLYQDKIIPWFGDDVYKVCELFKDTRIKYKIPENLKPITNEEYKFGDDPLGVTEDGWIVCEPKPRPWLIERALRYDGDYLTISEDGLNNRPWKKEEIENIKNIFDGLEIKENSYYIEELWKDQLSKMNISVVESYLRKIKLQKLL
jgi:hypothetical protein